MYKEILKEIQNFDQIAIFRHTHPDGDAIGSQLGLKTWILTYFKDKDVRALGFETFDRLPLIDSADDNFIKNCLAIVVDTANKERIDDDRFKFARKIIKIDHHPALDQYGDLNYVNEEAAATAEYLSEILSSFSDYPITKDAAKYLYGGILTDTLNFKTPSTSYKTLIQASNLAKTGIDLPQICASMFDDSYKVFRIKNQIRSLLKVKDGLGIIILNKDVLNELNITPEIAKTYISEFSTINELKIWILFGENEKGSYDGSLRSKKDYVINQVAQKYNGGGHPNASGIKNITKAQLDELIDILSNIVKT